ncbi:MAG: hypothetical protein K6D38_04910 [Pseudobutyrivibrio sp.]|nr:hypothetical protein [Pseudobutyrivibrio sp.]
MKRRYKRLVASLLLSLLLCGSTINVFADEPANIGGDTTPTSSTASSDLTTNSDSGNAQMNNDSQNQNGSGDNSQNGDDNKNQNGDDVNNQNGDDANNQNGDDNQNQNGGDANNQNGDDANNQNGDDNQNQNGDDANNQNGDDNQNQDGDDDNQNDDDDQNDDDNQNNDDEDDPSVEPEKKERYEHIHGTKTHNKITEITKFDKKHRPHTETTTVVEDCDIIEDVDGDYLVEKCSQCECEYSRKRLVPDVRIDHIHGDEKKDNIHYTSPAEFTILASCETATSPEQLKVYILAYDFTDPEGNKTEIFEATCEPEEPDTSADENGDDNDGNETDSLKEIRDAKYTCTVGMPGACYNVLGAVAVHEYKGEEYIAVDHDYSVINCINDEDASDEFDVRIIDNNGWTMDEDDDDNKWYSSKVRGNQLYVSLTCATKKELNTSQIVDENGDDAKLELVSQSDEVVVEEYENEEVWEGKLSHKLFKAIKKVDRDFFGCYKEKNVFVRTYLLPSNKDGKNTYFYNYKFQKRYSKSGDFTVYIDNTDPVLNLTYNGAGSPNGSAGAEAGFYNNQVEVVATVTENHPVNKHELEDLYLYDLTSNSKIRFTEKDHTEDDNGKRVYTYTAVASADGKYQVKGFVRDRAGNRCAEVNENQFIVDKEAPKVEITFDNDQALNEKYYKADRTATITVTDENFGTDDKFTKLELTEKTGKANPSGWENAGGDKYTKKVVFDQDGTYSFTLTVKDKAGNASEKQIISEFVIDKKAPEFEVSFDNNSASNENYYKSARKATITVKESSFSDSLVSITKMSDGEITSLPSVSGFTGSEDSHDATINFEADGKYGFVIKCTDLAGNESSEYTSGSFYIDTTAPEIEITGVANKSANNGAVTPVVRTTDKNINRDDITITLVGSNGGNYPATLQESAITDGFTFSIADIPHEKKFDDLYKLTVKTVDKAGNEKENVIDYSVNRFGSVFVLAGGTKELVDGYYVRKPQNVVIEEINVDKIANREVSVAFDGTYKALRANKDYSASEDIDAKGWHLNSYTIFANNFNNDGLYSVDVRTEDEATNRQSSQTREADIKFLVDATAPSVVVSGIEDGGKYVEDSHVFSVNTTDTIGVSDLAVYVDDEKIASYDRDTLNAAGGTEVLTLNSKDVSQKVVVVSHDVAGNETKLAYNVVVSLNAKSIDIEKKSDLPGDAKEIISNNPITRRVVGAVAGVAGVGAAGVGGVNLFRRRKLK